MSPSFPREYKLEYQGRIGTIFSPYSIEQCQLTEYNPDEIIPAHVSVGVDPSYGSSNFAITATRLINGKIQVIISEEYSRDAADFNSMINRINQIKNKYCITALYCDALIQRYGPRLSVQYSMKNTGTIRSWKR